MKCGELIEYLREFDPEKQIGFIVADLNSRKACIIGACHLFDETPALMLETTEYQPLDDLVELKDERKCRVCGCTQNNACPGGCYWVEEDLCSCCAEKERANP